MLCKPAASFSLIESIKIRFNIKEIIIYRLQQDFLLDDDNSNGVQLGQVNISFIYVTYKRQRVWGHWVVCYTYLPTYYNNIFLLVVLNNFADF